MEADVLVVQIEGDKGIWLSGIVAQPRRERGIAGRYVGDRFAYGCTARFDRLTVGELGKNGGEVEGDGHDSSPIDE